PRFAGFIDRGAQRRQAEQLLARVGATDIHPNAPVGELPLSRRQMVEIAKALARNPKILILDEATSALTAADVEKIFALLRRLRSEGMAIIYISHRMHEIAELADDCTVFRNGRYVETFAAGTKSDQAIVELMIGREYSNVFPPRAARRKDAAPVLSVRDLSWYGRLNGITLDVRPGEVLGLGGLDGQGQKQLLLALFGTVIGATGTVEIDGKPVKVSSPRQAKSDKIGIALIPEDRKNEGLMLPMSVRANLSFASVERFSRFGVVDSKAEDAAIAEMQKLLQIKSDGVDGPVSALSGGNQQKVVIGKWLMNKPRIILLNDPTRGIDVGTKQEFYQLLARLAGEGAAIIYYSTDYDELIGCCDRVLVLYDGEITTTLEGAELTERNLIGAALNLSVGRDAHIGSESAKGTAS
ncbi:MAG: sugar ABC transporter ATP-binding protein, partial [Devosia sp.]